MFGDANSYGAFGGPQLVVLGALIFSVAATVGLSLLGVPNAWLGVAFVAITISTMVLARPLFRRVAPRFESLEE